MKISVIIPTINYKYRKATIDLIAAQTHKDVEVILVYHSKNTANLAQIPLDYKHLDSTGLSYIVKEYEDAFNWSKMNNMGAKAATGDILIFMNDDVYLHNQDLFSYISDMFSDDKNIGVIGEYHNLSNNLGYYDNNLYLFKEVRGHFQAIRREDFLKIDGYDESYTLIYSDLTLCFKVWFNLNKVVVGNKRLGIEHHELSSRGVLEGSRDSEYKDIIRVKKEWFGKKYSGVFDSTKVEFYI